MKRWPLHPQPTSYETLETYVRRLAECYGVSYPCFCLHALGIPITDSEARRFKEPSPELLQELDRELLPQLFPFLSITSRPNFRK